MASGARKFKFISPGVFINEIDRSQLPRTPSAIGPVVIGRTRRGPGLRPVQVSSFEEFVRVFGAPDPGSDGSDNWRENNFDGPTYGAYAAQAWLASGQAPVTMVRLLGAQHRDHASAGKAGWYIAQTPDRDLADNGGAYGLFLINSGSARIDNMASASLTVTNYLNFTSSNTFDLVDYSNTKHTFTMNASAAYAAGSGQSIGFLGAANAGEPANLNGVYGTLIASAINDSSATTFGVITASSDGGSGSCVVTLTQVAGQGKEGNQTNTMTGFTNGASINNFVNGTGSNFVATSTGSLAAVWYLTSGSNMFLSGAYALSPSLNTGAAGALVQSSGDNSEFKATIQNYAGTIVDNVTFNFNRNSDRYIRKVFSTNASQTNGTVVATPEPYWLGETYDQFLST